MRKNRQTCRLGPAGGEGGWGTHIHIIGIRVKHRLCAWQIGRGTDSRSVKIEKVQGKRACIDIMGDRIKHRSCNR